MRTLVLYSALKNELPNCITEQVEYTINNGFLDYNKDYGISTYITDVRPTRVRLSGEKYEGHTATLQLLFLAGLTPDSVITTRSIIEDVESWLAELQNKKITTTSDFEILSNGKIHKVTDETDRQVQDATGIDLFISSTKLFTSTIQLGKTENGRELFSLNAAFSYYILGNHTDADDDTDNESAVGSESEN